MSAAPPGGNGNDPYRLPGMGKVCAKLAPAESIAHAINASTDKDRGMDMMFGFRFVYRIGARQA